MWRSRWRCVIKPAYSVSFLLSINIFVWQNVLYFLDAPRISYVSNVQLSSIVLGCRTHFSWNYEKLNTYSQDYILNLSVQSTSTHSVFFRTAKMYFPCGFLKNLPFAHRLGMLSVEILTFFGALEYNSADIRHLLSWWILIGRLIIFWDVTSKFLTLAIETDWHPYTKLLFYTWFSVQLIPFTARYAVTTAVVFHTLGLPQV